MMSQGSSPGIYVRVPAFALKLVLRILTLLSIVGLTNQHVRFPEGHHATHSSGARSGSFLEIAMHGHALLFVLALGGQNTEIDALISRLGNDQYEIRQQADDKLRKMGWPAIQALKSSALKHSDPEVRCRARSIISSYFDISLHDTDKWPHIWQFDYELRSKPFAKGIDGAVIWMNLASRINKRHKENDYYYHPQEEYTLASKLFCQHLLTRGMPKEQLFELIHKTCGQKTNHADYLWSAKEHLVPENADELFAW